MGQSGEGRRESAGEEKGDVKEPNKGEETKLENEGRHEGEEEGIEVRAEHLFGNHSLPSVQCNAH